MYIYQLISNVLLPGTNIFDSQMQMYTVNQKYDVILAKEFQHHPKKEYRKKCVFDQGKNNKRFMEIKCIDRQYHVQDNYDVAHTYVRIYCNENQFHALPFYGPHSKSRGARELSKHYHLHFYPKLGNVVCAIFRILCACVAFTSMLDKHWIYGIPSDKQYRYKPVTNCTYWPVLGPFKNWYIISLSQKSTPYDAFDEIHQVVLD